jgi:quercetin dioxygenase-like cupin family protein
MFLRVFTGPDGKSHVEEISLGSHPQLKEVQEVETIAFRKMEPGTEMDYHNAPRRQFVITLAGEMEIGLEDGSWHKLGAGDVLLAEDLTGKGHKLRVTSNGPRISAAIPLKDQTPAR